MKKLNLLFAASLLFFALGCDELCVDIPEITSEDTGRLVLIEEITGVSCPNCPAGAATIEGFKETFPGRVISVAYHSPPFLVAPLSDSQYDFRRDEAQAIDQYIGQSIGKPSATINRRQFDGEQRTWIDFIDKWLGYVQSELAEAPITKLAIENEFNPDTRELNINIKADPFRNAEGNYLIHVMILENHIVDPQLDQQQEIEDYEHNHVFHDLISTNISGDAFATGLTEGSVVEKTYNYTIPSNAEDPKVPWIAENCEIVAFITNEAGYVEQVAKKEVVE